MKAVRVKEVIAKAKQIYGIEEEAEREGIEKENSITSDVGVEILLFASFR